MAVGASVAIGVASSMALQQAAATAGGACVGLPNCAGPQPYGALLATLLCAGVAYAALLTALLLYMNDEGEPRG